MIRVSLEVDLSCLVFTPSSHCSPPFIPLLCVTASNLTTLTSVRYITYLSAIYVFMLIIGEMDGCFLL